MLSLFMIRRNDDALLELDACTKYPSIRVRQKHNSTNQRRLHGPGPVNHRDRLDHAERSNALEPPPGGTVFRFIAEPKSASDGGFG